MLKKGMGLQEAYDMVKSKRKQAGPNTNFRKQLEKFELYVPLLVLQYCLNFHFYRFLNFAPPLCLSLPSLLFFFFPFPDLSGERWQR